MSDRKEHWENVYKDKSPLEVSWYVNEPVLSLQLIANTQVSLNAPIIDVGGGASLLVDHLCDKGYDNLGVLDISANALACAKDRLGDRADKIEWYDNDVTCFNSPHQFSVWHDRAVFHFLKEESDRRAYVDVLKRALEPNGHVIIAAFAIGGPTQCSGLDIVQYNAEKLQAELGDDFELLEERSELHITPANKEQKFAYFRFIRKS
ncbi:MAG: class I SAM-dependent methyltransferase [Gammaproteobacteria bacterium]|nr:class I SAM-dependent methyltransferase [Gammaproteobacteria bacterium]